MVRNLILVYILVGVDCIDVVADFAVIVVMKEVVEVVF